VTEAPDLPAHEPDRRSGIIAEWLAKPAYIQQVALAFPNRQRFVCKL
jgi:hypothetical protein